jgi:hypothetical protein
MNRLSIIGSLMIFGVMAAACNTADPAATVQEGISKADAARTENVAEARKDGAAAIQREQQDVIEERRDVSDAEATKNYEVALAKAEGDYQIAVEACNALSGSAQVSCKDQAAAVRKSDTASAELLKFKG